MKIYLQNRLLLLDSLSMQKVSAKKLIGLNLERWRIGNMRKPVVINLNSVEMIWNLKKNTHTNEMQTKADDSHSMWTSLLLFYGVWFVQSFNVDQQSQVDLVNGWLNTKWVKPEMSKGAKITFTVLYGDKHRHGVGRSKRMVSDLLETHNLWIFGKKSGHNQTVHFCFENISNDIKNMI